LQDREIFNAQLRVNRSTHQQDILTPSSDSSQINSHLKKSLPLYTLPSAHLMFIGVQGSPTLVSNALSLYIRTSLITLAVPAL